MNRPQPTLIASLILICFLALTGCQETADPTELRITDELAEEVTRGSLMLGALAVDLALHISDPPGVNGCPASTEGQDSLLLDYGPGCLSESGLFELGLLGSVSFTLAGGSGVFIGEMNSLGFPNLPLIGSLSGQITRAGDLVAADIEFSEVKWTDDGLDNQFDGLFEIIIDGDQILLNLASGQLLRGGEPYFRVDLEDIVPAETSMGPCWLPVAGTANLEREMATATMVFTEAAHEAGQVQVNYGSRDPAVLEPCGS